MTQHASPRWTASQVYIDSIPENKRDQVIEELCLAYPTWFLEVLCEFHGKPLVLQPFQIEYLLNPSPFRIINKTRQAGGSLQLSMDKFYRAYRRPSYRCDIVSTSLAESVDKIKYIKDLHETLPKRFRIPLTIDNALSIGFHKGSRLSIIKSVAATPKSVRGGSKEIVLDEFAHVPKSREIFLSAVPSIMRGDLGVDIVSTPKGDLNTFADIWKNEIDPFTGLRPYDMFSRQQFIWLDVPDYVTDYDRARYLWYEEYNQNIDVMRDLVMEFGSDKIKIVLAQFPWEWFLQEYCGVFLSEIDAFFSWELIQSCLRGRVASADDGQNGVYEEALIPWTLNEGRPDDSMASQVFLGVDFGESDETTDKTSIQVLERLPSGHFMHRYSEVLNKREYPSFPAQARYISYVAKQFKVNKILGDHTGLGRGVMPLIHEELPSFAIEDVNFNLQSKEAMVMNLKTLMEQGRIWIQEKDLALQGQIRGIRRTVSPSGNFQYSGEPHDDMFWALALAAKSGQYTEFAIYSLGPRTIPNSF